MQRLAVLLYVLTAVCFGQTATDGLAPTSTPVSYTAEINEANTPVTQTDLYCAGYVSPQVLPRDRFVGGGLETPMQTRYGDRDLIFLRGGGYTPGTRVSFVREMRDPNEFSPFRAAQGALKHLGQLYSDIGYATILEIRGTDTAVAQVEFACENILPGDLVVPFVAKTPVSYRHRSSMDRFPANSPKVSGRIVAAREFEQYIGAGRKIYVNLGEQSGLKPGDYFRVVRDYNPKSMDVSDAEVFNQTISEDTQRHPPVLKKSQLRELPRRVIGEAIVLSAQPGTSTAMVTFAVEDIHVGDVVEVEEEPGQGQ